MSIECLCLVYLVNTYTIAWC